MKLSRHTIHLALLTSVMIVSSAGTFAAVNEGSNGSGAPSEIAVKSIDLTRNPVKSVPSNCFWIGALTRKEDALNILYPDASATYWISQFKLPPGAKLRLNAEFAHARYLSYTSYDSMGQATDGLNDAAIAASQGSHNPFLPDNDRLTKDRKYVVEMVNQTPPDATQARLANTLYAKSDEGLVQIYYRAYVPDQGKDITGGVGLPEPELVLADGKVFRDKALCDQIVVSKGAVRERAVPKDKYLAMLGRKGVPPTFPAMAPPVWENVANAALTISRVTLAGTPEGDQKRLRMDQTRRGGWYGALDNRYIMLYMDRRLGKVLTLKGKLPTTPVTRNSPKTMDVTQLRYWSICVVRSLADTSVGDCLFDEEIALDADRNYTIVVSRKEDRPENARRECGITWLDWREIGDGVNNRDGGALLVRNMLPAPTFKNSIFEVKQIGDEQRILGPYYPTPSYTSKAGFEGTGCNSALSPKRLP